MIDEGGGGGGARLQRRVTAALSGDGRLGLSPTCRGGKMRASICKSFAVHSGTGCLDCKRVGITSDTDIVIL